MQGNVVYLVIAGLIVLIVLVVLITWTTRQLNKTHAGQGNVRGADHDHSASSGDGQHDDAGSVNAQTASFVVPESSATDAEMAVSFRSNEASAQVSSATVLVDGGPPEVVATLAPTHTASPASAEGSDHRAFPTQPVAQLSGETDRGTGAEPRSGALNPSDDATDERLQRRQARIEAMLRELEAARGYGSGDGASGPAEQTPPLVLDALEAQDGMSALGEDEVVHLSAYEARVSTDEGPLQVQAQETSQALDSPVGDDVVSTFALSPDLTFASESAAELSDSRGVVLPSWLKERLMAPGVLGWLVVWPDGTCSSSDQLYDESVIQHFAKLVNQAIETAVTVGLETASEINMRGEDGAIVVAPLASYEMSTDAFLVVFVEGEQVASGWLGKPDDFARA